MQVQQNVDGHRKLVTRYRVLQQRVYNNRFDFFSITVIWPFVIFVFTTFFENTISLIHPRFSEVVSASYNSCAASAMVVSASYNSCAASAIAIALKFLRRKHFRNP